MKTKYPFLFLFLSFFISNIVYSQTFISEISDFTLKSFIEENTKNNFLADNTVIDEVVFESKVNTVFIDQIGNGNDATVKTIAKTSEINIKQKGDNNEVFLGIIANSINESVFQTGNNNHFTDFSLTRGNHNMELLQSGNHQNLIWYGGNSISEELKVNMTGNTSSSIIIRNFN